ncbi:MAG: glycosyltransferase family 9 protein [Candidatus Puniceispirillaceae bacterium]
MTNPADPSDTPPQNSPGFGRAIGFVAGGIGDQIYHLDQLRALAGGCRTGTIDIACIHPGPISRILAATPWVGRVVDARPIRRFKPWQTGNEVVKALRLHRYDTAFFMHRSTSFKLAARAAAIPRRIGLAGSMIDRLLLETPLALDGGGSRRKLWGHRPFIAALDDYVLGTGLRLDPATPTIIPDRDSMKEARRFLAPLPGPVTVVNLFALDDRRRWPVDAAIAVIAALAASGGSFILNAGPDAAEYHRQTMDAWADHCRNERSLSRGQLVDSLGPDASMERDIALYHLADHYLGVDSFTANLAMNCNLPAVILFAWERDRLSYRSRVEAVLPATQGDLATTTADDVIAAFQRLQQGETSRQKDAAQPLPL